MASIKSYKFIILGCCFVLFFTHLDVLPVTIMEARNFITAREMLTDNHWLLTTMNGAPRYEKPPLPTWLSAISAFLFGIKSIAAYRLPVALMSTFTVFIFFTFIKYVSKNERLAFIASLILGSSFYVIAIQREAPWDIYAHGFMLASVFYLFRLFSESQKRFHYGIAAGIFLGLSLLSKGPVAPYALFLPFLIAFGWVYRYHNLKRKILPLLLALCIGIVLGGWWFFYVRHADPAPFLEISRQETSRWGSYNVRPFYYYWSFFTQSGIWTIPAFIALCYPYLKTRVSESRLYKFALIWTLSILVLLSVIPEKKSRYLLPILIPLALTTSFYIEYLILYFKSAVKRNESLPVYFNFSLIALIGVLFPFAGYFFLKDVLSGSLWFYFIGTALLLPIIGVNILYNLKKKEMYRVFLLTVGFMLVLIGVGLPLSKALKTNPAYNNIAHLKLENAKLYSTGTVSPEMIWYYGDKIALRDADTGDQHYFLLVSPAQSKNIEKNSSNTHTFERIDTFDLNYSAKPGDRKHKERLVNILYSVKKQP